MSREFLFSSESVSEGHPDKVADQISDSVLDAILAVDKHSRVACETLVSTGLVVISGEITTTAHINYREIAQETIKRIGYDNSDIGFDYKSCAVLAAINRHRHREPRGGQRRDHRLEQQADGDGGGGEQCQSWPHDGGAGAHWQEQQRGEAAADAAARVDQQRDGEAVHCQRE